VGARYTSQLVVSDTEAYAAISIDRSTLGPNGEPRIAYVLRTTNSGLNWVQLPWRRSLASRIRYPGFPTWPPEAVLTIARDARDGSITITHRDEWVPFEPGGESLWRSCFDGSTWTVHKLRAMDYEGADSPASIPGITLSLPTSIQPPNNALQATCEDVRA
jgi:hypothetical protein